MKPQTKGWLTPPIPSLSSHRHRLPVNFKNVLRIL